MPPCVQAEADALKAMQDATKLAPNNAVYWQSLGDVLGGDASASPRRKWRDGSAKAADAYAKSLALQPRNAPLWYRLYEQAGRRRARTRRWPRCNGGAGRSRQRASTPTCSRPSGSRRPLTG